jgi:GT2 family glycosyltransferase
VEVIVVDNCSGDGSMTSLSREYAGESRVKMLFNRCNLGFARACNRGVRSARGQYLLFLNPDCAVEPKAITRMIVHMEQHPQVGLAGCVIRNLDGTEQESSRRVTPTPWRSLVSMLKLNRLFPDNPQFNGYSCTDAPIPTQPVEVEAISGAFMFTRRSALREVGLLDKRYFLHCEDLDWCMRFRLAGWKVLWVPDVEAHHAGGVCSTRTPFAVLWHKHRGMIRYYEKFFRHRYPVPLMWLVRAAIWGRFMLLVAIEGVWPRRGAFTALDSKSNGLPSRRTEH